MALPSDLPPDQVRTFVIAAHSDLTAVQTMLAESPTLLDVAHEWGPGDTETPIQAAAHVGNRPIAEFLLDAGAPLAIYTAAMLGRRKDVEALVRADPRRVEANGAHRIPLLPHAAFSGDPDLFAWLVQQGARDGQSFALHNAAARGHTALVRWLLANGSIDLGWTNFQGRTALETAEAQGHTAVVALLRDHATD